MAPNTVVTPRNREHAGLALVLLSTLIILGTMGAGRGSIPRVASSPSPNAEFCKEGLGPAWDRPKAAFHNATHDVFWFLHVTDTQSIWDSAGEIADFARFLNVSFRTIDPAFVVHTGDIVNSDYHDFFRRGVGQLDWEWEPYGQLLATHGMNLSVYKDFLGNHDKYRDPGASWYRTYAMVGRETGELQHAWNYTTPGGKVYAFLGLNTPEDHGIEYPFALFGYLNGSELDWYERELQRYAAAEMTFIFGHHPPYEIVSSTTTSGSRATFGQLNQRYGVDAFFVGHGHINDVEDARGVRAIETEKFSNGGGAYRIVAIDGRVLSSQAVDTRAWPQGVITNPGAGDHLYGDLAREELRSVDGVRVLAWDPAGVTGVEVKLGGGTWRPARQVSGALWEAPWDPTLETGGNHRVEARVTGGSGTRTFQISYTARPGFEWSWFPGAILMVVAFLGIAVVAPTGVFVARRRNPARFGKRPRDRVAPTQKKLFVAKCLVFLCVPLTFGLMLVETPTAIFALFYAHPTGVYFYSTNLIYTSVLWLFGILGMGFALSAGARRKTYLFGLLSIIGEVFELVFYTLHFPTIAWFAPGLYGLIALDVLMMRGAARLTPLTPSAA